MKPTTDRNRRTVVVGRVRPCAYASRFTNPETTHMYVTATAYDTIDQKIAEVGFEGFAEIAPGDLVQEALRRLLLVVPARPFARIGITLD